MLAVLLAATHPALASRPPISEETMRYVSVPEALVAITHVQVVDGSGSPARQDQTIVLDNGVIVALGSTALTPVPAGARLIDGTGKTATPGLVHMHEHLFYGLKEAVAASFDAWSFTKLYLAGGVTSLRTVGAFHFAGDLHVRDAINRGDWPGPWMDVTSPFIEGEPAYSPQMMSVRSPEDAARAVNFYADQGATSIKAYQHLTRAELAATIAAAHKRGLKVAGHLCAVTVREAVDLGIDSIEHGFNAASDFRAGKEPDQCIETGSDFSDAKKVSDLMDYLIRKGVALDDNVALTDTDRETPGMDVLAPDVALLFYEQRLEPHPPGSPPQEPLRPVGSPPNPRLLRKIAMDKLFYDKGGLLMIGTDVGGSYGGLVPGFANIHEIEVRAENGFKFEEVLKASTLNGAIFLGRDNKIGTLAVGKQADIVLVEGDPVKRPRDMRNVVIVFKQGYGYDPKKLIDSVRGKAGLY